MHLSTFSYSHEDLSLMPRRAQDSNKGSFGRVLCVCGSVGMAGAAFLCAKAVLRTGAGLVEVLTPEENRTVIQTLLPEAIVSVYSSNEPNISIIDKSLEKADTVVCGCGLGISRASLAVVRHVLEECRVPTVLDADALNLISRNPSLYKLMAGKIITPHPAEMSRLSSLSVEDITRDRNQVCFEFADKHRLVCVLKGHRTAVSDGERIYVNTSGNSGMATAGSGDVLAGIIAGILAQSKNSKLSLLEAASLGVYVHGLCGDLAAAQLGEYSVIASDIIACLPKVLKSVNK